MTSDKRDSPIELTVSLPSMIGPASKSIYSLNDFAVLELLETFITGATGFPVGVPKPVEKRMRLAPAPANAVVDSTSFPAVHRRERPSFLTHPGNQGHP